MKMKWMVSPAIVAAVGLMTVAGARAAAPQSNAQDVTFVKMAAQGGTAEVKLATLALSKSTTSGVVAFATHMKADHTQGNAQLKSIALAQNMVLPDGVGAKNAMLMERLGALSGSAFDAGYLKSQLPAHEQMLTLFRSEVASGMNPALISFAKATIPVIEKHIAMDRRDMAAIGAAGAMAPMSMQK